ncbi:hypothetical protein ZWY2020_039802 [Hordeum vulgare]|nr:hypothetical protein ZWY2020_039802 [Hordeum vulgare]
MVCSPKVFPCVHPGSVLHRQRARRSATGSHVLTCISADRSSLHCPGCMLLLIFLPGCSTIGLLGSRGKKMLCVSF